MIALKRFFLLIIVALSVLNASAQTRKIDRLKRLAAAAHTPSQKLQALLVLCQESETLPKDTLWNRALQAKALAEKLHNDTARSWALVAQANAYLRWNNSDSARMLIQPELAKYRIENTATRKLYFKMEQTLIDCTDIDYHYKDGTAQVYNVMRQAEKYKDPEIVAECMNTLGSWDYDMNFVDRSTQWHHKALALVNSNPKFYRVLAGISLNLSGNYNWVHQLDSADKYIRMSIQVSSQLQNLFFLSVAYENQTTYFIHKHDYASAEQAMSKSIALDKQINDGELQQDKVLILASVYENMGQLDKAIQVMNDGLAQDSINKTRSPHAKKGNERDLQRVFYYNELAKCYKRKGDSKNYEATLEKIIAGQDAFYKANSAQEMADMQAKYDMQKQEATIAQQKLQLTNKNYLFYGSLVILALGMIIVGIVIQGMRRNSRLKLEHAGREQAIMATKAAANAEENERKRIAADLHDNLGAQLSSMRRNLNIIMEQPEGFSEDDEQKYLGYVNDLARSAMIDLRETIWVLNREAIYLQEFSDKLKAYMQQQLFGHTDISWDFEEQIAEDWQLNSGEVMHLFRIMQELVSNIIKHAGANHINIALKSPNPGHYLLEVTDNGIGFVVNDNMDGHYGMENMRLRANEIGVQLSLFSKPGSGTTAILTKGGINTLNNTDAKTITTP